MSNITKKLCVNSKKTYTFEKTEGRTEGQKDGWKDGLEVTQTLTNPDKPSSYGWGSNKTFAYICQEINHYISQSFFIMTLNT